VPSDLILLAAGAAVAGFVQGLTGFAFGLVAMSIWVWGIAPGVASVMVVVGGFSGQLLSAVRVRRMPPWAMLLPLMGGALLGIPLGVAVLPHINAAMFKLGFGAMLVLWCPLMLFSQRLPRLTAGGPVADGVVGLGAGVLGGIGGFTGVLPTLWCTLRGMDKDVQRAVIQNFNLATLAITLAAYLATGVVTRAMWPMIAVVVPALMLPAVLGAKVYVGLSELAFRRIVLSLLTAAGLAMLAAALPQVLR
jgi:uncharacterized membrane protein YfcA